MEKHSPDFPQTDVLAAHGMFFGHACIDRGRAPGRQLVARIRSAGGRVLGGQLAVDVQTGAGGLITGVVARDREGAQTVHEADAVILAVSVSGTRPGRLCAWGVGVLVHAVLHGWLLGAGAVLFPDQHWL
jgi:hypothetical protein